VKARGSEQPELLGFNDSMQHRKRYKQEGWWGELICPKCGQTTYGPLGNTFCGLGHVEVGMMQPTRLRRVRGLVD
jgi:hypothetical protein